MYSVYSVHYSLLFAGFVLEGKINLVYRVFVSFYFIIFPVWRVCVSVLE